VIVVRAARLASLAAATLRARLAPIQQVLPPLFWPVLRPVVIVLVRAVAGALAS